jgi:hypothetical protein
MHKVTISIFAATLGAALVISLITPCFAGVEPNFEHVRIAGTNRNSQQKN